MSGTLAGVADYVFQSFLGRANNGEFYLAPPPARLGLNEPQVAVKVLDGANSADTFRRATRELRAFAVVISPYLVTIYDAGQDGERFYYAMEHATLGSLAQPARPVTRAEALAALGDGARAAGALHRAGMAHRDIGPHNIWLYPGGGKLADLGLAQILDRQTMTGMGHVGSVEYMDPAILRGERASEATDIWALGVTLHRVLSGAGVFGDLPANDPLLGIRTVLSAAPALAPNLHPADRAVIEGCLAPAGQRYGSAADLAAAIDALPR